jgi:predicted DNA-binding transcriptional regulator AlpA
MQKVLRMSDLRAYDGLGRTQRKEYIKRNEYPPPAQTTDIKSRAKIWFEAEIIAWQRWRRARRDGTAAGASSWRDYLEPTTAQSES